MDKYLLESINKRVRIAPLNIVRENIEMSLLDIMYQSKISNRIIFYGGTALRLAYGSPRFSVDLDFLMTEHIELNEFKGIINVFLLRNPGSSVKEIVNKRNTLFCLINIIEPYLKYPINIKIEICKRKNGIKTEFIPLISPCSHIKPIVLCATIESLKQMKQYAIMGREDAKDWFDYWFICKWLKQQVVFPVEFPFDKKEFERELKRFLPVDKWKLIKQIYDKNTNIIG